MVSEIYIELISSEPDGILTDEFFGKISNFGDWKCFSKFYGITAPIDMIRQYHHKFIPN